MPVTQEIPWKNSSPHGINGDGGSRLAGWFDPKKSLIQAPGSFVCSHFSSPGGISGIHRDFDPQLRPGKGKAVED